MESRKCISCGTRLLPRSPELESFADDIMISIGHVSNFETAYAFWEQFDSFSASYNETVTSWLNIDLGSHFRSLIRVNDEVVSSLQVF